MISQFRKNIVKLITSQSYLQDDDHNSFIRMVITTFLILSACIIASYIALWKANDLSDTPLALAINNDAVYATSITCMLISIALLLDIIYDITYIALLINSSKSKNIEIANNWLLTKDIIIKLNFVIGLSLPNIGIVAMNATSSKASLFVINSTLQNCIIALATFFRLLKSNDAILNPTYFILLYCFYNIGQCCDIWNNLHYYKENEFLENLYNIFIYTSICGVLLMMFFSFIRLFIKIYENLRITIEDYVIVFIMIPFLFTILWVQVAITHFLKDSANVSILSNIANLQNSQFASIALILVLYFIPQRLSRQKIINETQDDLVFAHQLLKKSYDPLRFVQKNLNKFITADELEEIPRSIMLNTIVAQCTTAIAAYETSVGNNSSIQDIDKRQHGNMDENKDDIIFVPDDGFEINLREEASEMSSITFNHTEYELTRLNSIELKVKDTDKDNIIIVDIDDNNLQISNSI